MKPTKKMVAALLSVTRNETLINLVTDVLLVEEVNGWRGPVIQELLEETRKFYEPKDIDADTVTNILRVSDALKDKKLIEGSVKVLRVLNTQNEININYDVEGEDWTHQYNISVDEYLEAKNNA